MSIPDRYLTFAHLAIDRAPDALDSTGYRAGRKDSARDAFDPKGVATALAFIHSGPVRQVRVTAKRVGYSYELKHDAEHWGERLGFSSYVSNGDFICAALYAGLEVRPLESGNPNAYIGLRVLDSTSGDGRVRSFHEKSAIVDRSWMNAAYAKRAAGRRA